MTMQGVSQIATGLSQAITGSIPVVTSRATLSVLIRNLGSRQKLVVLCHDPRNAKSNYYLRVLQKYQYRARGRHRFVIVKGGLARSFAQKLPRVLIATRSGFMTSVSLHQVPHKLGLSRQHILPRAKPFCPTAPRPGRALDPWEEGSPRPLPPSRLKPASILKPRPKPVVRPRPVVKMRPKKAASPSPSVVRFYPFGRGLFCIEVRTNAKPTSAHPTTPAQTRPGARGQTGPATGGDDHSDTEVSF